MTMAMQDSHTGPINAAAKFHPAHNEDELPAIEVAGVLVFVYMDTSGALRVTVDTETADAAQFIGTDEIPIRIKVNEDVAYDATIGDDYVSFQIPH